MELMVDNPTYCILSLDFYAYCSPMMIYKIRGESMELMVDNPTYCILSLDFYAYCSPMMIYYEAPTTEQ
jgi:hypothetical protein